VQDAEAGKEEGLRILNPSPSSRANRARGLVSACLPDLVGAAIVVNRAG
jgi:hypothetical protein